MDGRRQAVSRVGRMKKPLLMFSAKAELKKARPGWGFLLSLILLAGCQAFTGGDDSGTLAAEMTLFVTEAASIQQAAAIDQTRAVETLAAAAGTVSAVSAVNLALAATVNADVTAAPAVRAAVVSAADMGSSLDMEMMDDRAASDDGLAVMRVSDIAAARRVNPNNGCSSGLVTQFSGDDERIYVTARVSGLRDGTHFGVDWFYGERVVYRSSWQADYSAQFECIWFYAVADDFSFLPGGYTAVLYVNGAAEPSIQFSIRAD